VSVLRLCATGSQVWPTALAALLFAGCADRPSDGNGGRAGGDQAVRAASSSVVAPASSAALATEKPHPAQDSRVPPIVDADGLKQLVARYRGKVVYLDFWATWCAPCVAALPKLAELQKQYGPRGLQVIAVSFDDPELWASQVRPTLAKAGWRGPAVVMKDREAQNAVVAWLGHDWRSELPARFLLDREGRRAYELLAISPAERAPTKTLIEELLRR